MAVKKNVYVRQQTLQGKLGEEIADWVDIWEHPTLEEAKAAEANALEHVPNGIFRIVHRVLKETVKH